MNVMVEMDIKPPVGVEGYVPLKRTIRLIQIVYAQS